jgi:hypothetical protein
MAMYDPKNGPAPFYGIVVLDADIVKAAKVQANHQIATYTLTLSLEYEAVFAAVVAAQ